MCDQEFRTLRIDPRYPFTNQTKACFDNYVDFYRCRRLLGEEADDCRLFKRYFETICPAAWTEHWDEQRAQGTFPAPL
ncbi:hypothetical protein JYU34_021584 [Plutella xylostella]|uniref:Uncharacterized protein n=2 Tax=Plutella xylostella TaxID=51655 RepID=A0ABQ7PTY1_PLUXY|nr:cytochrome c oxidase subunit 6b-2 [Plutella xylostella]KAG7296427.1 hypothetical protein JYU34_021584 [Plutella xylostella]CAG9086964.1 unnamed protein product [Plutella xylostella]